MGFKVKPDLEPEPLELDTAMSPLVPLPTVATIWKSELIVNDEAAVPPKVTLVVPRNLFPVIVTNSPLWADVGENEEMVGATGAVKK